MKRFYSVSELAQLLGISRTAVWYKIQFKQIKAKKIGKNYIIESKYLPQEIKEIITTKEQ